MTQSSNSILLNTILNPPTKEQLFLCLSDILESSPGLRVEQLTTPGCFSRRCIAAAVVDAVPAAVADAVRAAVAEAVCEDEV